MLVGQMGMATPSSVTESPGASASCVQKAAQDSMFSDAECELTRLDEQHDVHGDT